MKKIYFTLFILMSAIAGMAYLYFSNLTRETSYQETSLYAATANSGLIFCIQNEKSVFEVLKGQHFFRKLLGEEKFGQLSLLKNELMSGPTVSNLIGNHNIFISFAAGKNKEIDYLVSTQLNDELEKPKLITAIQSKGITITTENGILKLALKDSSLFYLNIEKNLILLSNNSELIKTAMVHEPTEENHQFVAYIKSGNKFSKNSLGNLYVDFNKVPAILKSILPGNLNGSLSVFNHQNSFATFNYNFSRERVFFNGNSEIHDPKNYLKLFTALSPQQNSIDNLLPENTANFRLYAMADYNIWKKSLANWFQINKEDQKVNRTIQDFNKEYHLNTADIFPAYFKNQFITFQLKTSENLAAVNLTNGDKVKQFLLDMSDDYNPDIKRFKKSGLLYCYFGEPFKQFSRPYYTIIDNNMIVSNQPAALSSFLEAYRSNKLLINTQDYINIYSQISKTANITYYINRKNSGDLVRKTIYLPYYNHYINKQGLEGFSSFVYQLSGDKGEFQTNLLLNTIPEISPDTLENLTNK